MKSIKIALAIGALALVAGPAALAAGKPEGTGRPEGSPPYGKGHGPEYTPAEPTPGPKAGLPEQAKAYGRYCQGKSKEHVKGEQGTEFSQCVTNVAQAATHKNMAPGQVCKSKSKKHAKGEKGTEFSRCVKEVNEFRKKKHEEEKGA